MKKIGLLFDDSSSFAQELIGILNIQGPENLLAEPLSLSQIPHDKGLGYELLLNLHSQEIGLYRSFLQSAALRGTTILNNPFLFSGFDRFVASVAAENVLLNVPETSLLPSYDLPPGTSHRSFPNLQYPWDWDQIFEYTSFPAIMKPVQGGTAHQIHRVDSREEFFEAQRISGNQAMILQRLVPSDEVYLCFYVGNSYQEVMVLPYDAAHGSFLPEEKNPHPILSDTLKMHTRALADEYGCDLCAFVFAINQEEPYFIDVHNPSIFLRSDLLGPARFRNLVNATADMILEKVSEKEQEGSPLSWGIHLNKGSDEPVEETPAAPDELPDLSSIPEIAEKEEDGDEFLLIDTAGEGTPVGEDGISGAVVDMGSEASISDIPNPVHPEDPPKVSPLPPESMEWEAPAEAPTALASSGSPDLTEPPMITYSDNPQQEELKSWQGFNKEEVLKEEIAEVPKQEDIPLDTAFESNSIVGSQGDSTIHTHLAPSGIHISDSKMKVIERVGNRIHQINFHRIGRALESEHDDLKKIIGIGPFIEEKLNALQIYTFRQIAQFIPLDEQILNEILEFYPGRIERDEWVKQAKELMGE